MNQLSPTMHSPKLHHRVFDLEQLQLDNDQSGWLAEGELVELSQCLDHSRRRQWLGGRYVAKALLLEHWEEIGASTDAGVDVRKLCIHSRNVEGQGVAPDVLYNGERIPVCLSISHSGETVVAAMIKVENSSSWRIGVDIIGNDSGFHGDQQWWMSGCEINNQHRQKNGIDTNLLWAHKEAVYKAANTGESFLPGRIEFRNFTSRLSESAESEFGFEANYYGRTLSGESQILRTKLNNIVIVQVEATANSQARSTREHFSCSH